MIRILMIEDDTHIAKGLQYLLKKEAYDVEIAGTIQEGKEAVERGDFHLLLLDVTLPDGDGFSFFQWMKGKRELPVIFLTAKSDLGSKIRGLKAGAEDYLVKPFEMLELLVRIEKVLERNGKNDHLICIYDVEIDTEKHTVKKAGQEVYLKPMEYECLLMFVQHKNKALTRGQILGALWGMEFEGETRTVDAHVGRIRKKLDWGNVIKTIPTIGYRLEVDQ